MTYKYSKLYFSLCRVPVDEEVTIHKKVTLPRSVYLGVLKEFGLDGQDNITIQNTMQYDVKCSTWEVLQAMHESKAHRECPWVQDLDTIKNKNVIFVEVMITCEKKASNFETESVVTSVTYKCEGKMILVFSQSIDTQKIPNLQCIIKNALVHDTKPYTPGDLETNFECAYLYLNLAKPGICMTSFQLSLEEFCSHINSIVHKYSKTSAIGVQGYNAMDGSETMKMSEQTEKIKPHTNPTATEHDSKDISYSVDQDHQVDLLGKLNSTSGKGTFGSINHLMNNPVLDAEVQDKTFGSQNNDQKYLDSQRNDEKDAQILLNWHCPSDAYQMKPFHREENLTQEFVSRGNHSTLESTIKDPVRDVAQFCSDSNTRNMYPLLDKREQPMNTVCDAHHSHYLQDNNTLNVQNQSTLTSDKCSVSDGEHLSMEHSHLDPKSKHIKFCSMKAVACDEVCSGFKRKYFGLKSTSEEEKVIILIGNKGSGKSTLINFAANFFKGIETADDKLFLVTMNQIYEESSTYSVTAYTFCFAEDDVPVTIIDTRGLEDIKGTGENNPLQALKTFFTSNASNVQLHAIGYVISFSAVCLTSSERHMIDFLTEQYGQGISTNFITFVTFDAEIGRTCPVIDILKSYGIKSKVFLKFNNTAFTVKEIDGFDEIYWKRGIKNWKKCIKVLKELPPLTIKTQRVKQKQIYSTYLMKSLEDKLKSELKSFIQSFKEINSMTQLIQEKSEQVWQSSVVLYQLLSFSDCSFSDVESVLVKYVDEVAKESSFSSKYCVMLLSLCPSRGLLEAGKRVIECLLPIYDRTKAYELHNTHLGKKPEVLYCNRCFEHHRIQRVENKSKRSEDAIIYQCVSCYCDEREHVSKAVSQRCEKKCDLSRDCLKHTKNAIESILQEFSIPGHVFDVETYLGFVGQNLDEEFKGFIDCILNS